MTYRYLHSAMNEWFRVGTRCRKYYTIFIPYGDHSVGWTADESWFDCRLKKEVFHMFSWG